MANKKLWKTQHQIVEEGSYGNFSLFSFKENFPLLVHWYVWLSTYHDQKYVCSRNFLFIEKNYPLNHTNTDWFRHTFFVMPSIRCSSLYCSSVLIKSSVCCFVICFGNAGTVGSHFGFPCRSHSFILICLILQHLKLAWCTHLSRNQHQLIKEKFLQIPKTGSG